MAFTGLVVDEGEFNFLFSALEDFKNIGCDVEDEREIWCYDWLWRSKREMPTKFLASNAKAALKRMKSFKNILDVLTGSVVNAIKHVTEQSAHDVRVVGFSSLPDDVIARIFELHHEEMREEYRTSPSDSVYSPKVLSGICKRFRRIALHLPCLWEDVSSEFGREWVDLLRERCQNSKVFIDHPYETSKKAMDFLQHARPTNEWKELHIRYHGAKAGRMIFYRLCTSSQGKFKNLRNLTIEYNRFGLFFDNDDHDEVDTAASTTLLSDVDNMLLSQWKLPSVEILELKNIIPREMICPSLKHLTIDLDRDYPDSSWDIDDLHELFWRVPSIESLRLKFCRATVLPEGEYRDDSWPVHLLNLRFLSLDIMFNTHKKLIRRVMDMIDAPNASKLYIYMRHDSETDDVGPNDWLSGIFESQTGMIRTFPNVEDLEVVVEDVFCNALPYDKVLRAVPRVRNLSFNIPGGILAPVVKYIGETFGCLRDFRSLCIKNCAGWNTRDVDKLVEYFSGLAERGELGGFENLKLEGCSKFVKSKQEFEQLLGKRFIWKD
ncbi:hypothetical protein SCHPADRAFT_1001242 [Schizopora paradoxa]|uniref:F-box domain-containing protein n=1 Tax=Schizopora paradoxa TaxID=27342 RepID=A0A0H2RER1_9AGAM|nr:hypothetical protein SCHPADRAFT_1001242 [Schizopora paradoxa]